jgi:hypothetical protein
MGIAELEPRQQVFCLSFKQNRINKNKIYAWKPHKTLSFTSHRWFLLSNENNWVSEFSTVSCKKNINYVIHISRCTLLYDVVWCMWKRRDSVDTSGKQGISPGSFGPSVPVAQPGLTNRDLCPIFSPGCYKNRD